jgi:F-type H+-transporting ATPase subunit delta
VRDETVARNYAEALFELAGRRGQREAYGEAMESVARILAENPNAKLFLETPRIDPEAKKRVLRSVLGEGFPRPVLNFLLVTIDKRRQRLIQAISTAYHELLDDELGRTHVEVTVARTFDDQALATLAERLSVMLGKQAVPHVRVKPSVLGGVMLKTGDTVYDGTLRRRLEGMRRSLLAAALPERDGIGSPADAG